MACAATVVLVCVSASAASAPGRTLTFEQRVASQKAIEEVYWRHRIWPKDNPGTKPPLSEVMPDAAIRAKVENYLKESNALDRYWNRPISAPQLQAEMERMARESRDPAMLRELFAALADDPFLIAECLARPAIADRLLRTWYGADERFQGDTRALASAAMGRRPTPADLPTLRGCYSAETWVREGAAVSDEPSGEITTLPSDEWDGRLAELARAFGHAATPPVGVVSPLKETDRSISVIAVTALHRDRARVETVVWPKPTFADWWGGARGGISSKVASPADRYAIVVPASTDCTDDTWTPTHFESPDPRRRHTAVWTGSEMIVWGGLEDNNRANSGFRYNPATDTWTNTSVGANVPTEREYHSAVWTGTEMIVWGGARWVNGVRQLLNDGGRYNPMTDTWTPTSTGPNVPPGSQQHTAVWTGTYMIIWGGSPITDPPNGGRYNPATDSWLPVANSTVNVPYDRVDHTAVWTGQYMIIWGGQGTATFSHGGRYDPNTDSWLPVSMGPNAPSARYSHSAVWTGSEMIVWGGRNTVDLSDGGRYDPSTDTWQTTSTGPNNPLPRSGHVAVWSGSRMVVWGGAYAVGGRYDPVTDTWAPRAR